MTVIEIAQQPFEEFPRFGRSVSFSETKVEIPVSPNNEKEYLCPQSTVRSLQRVRSRPRMSSVFHMVDSKFAGGIVTRTNYMTRCFRTAWEINTGDIECLRFLLWNGESSQSVSWQAFSGLLLQFIFPFLPLAFIPISVRESGIFRGLAWTLFTFEFLTLLWYLYIIFVINANRKSWKQAWFTFAVPRGTIGLVDSGESHELTLFHFSANIRFVKTTFSTIIRLHTISKHEQEFLEEDMRRRNLEECEIILYTEDFLNCYSSWPKYMTASLIVCQFLSVIFIMILLT